MKIKKKKKSRKKIDPEERKKKIRERSFKTAINTVFNNASFTQISTREKDFTVNGSKGELDNIFFYENIMVISEDTCSESRYIGDHLRKKGDYFEYLRANKNDLFETLSHVFPDFKRYISTHPQYTTSDYNVILLYCSLHPVNPGLKQRFNQIKFFDYAYIKYFERLSKTIHKTARFELFKFLGLNKSDISIYSGQNHKEIEAFLLPEARSGFDENHKIVTFYIEPESLLSLSYVLRKDASWTDMDALYQRLLIRSKINNMREYISKNKRVFINNIIVTLPEETRFVDAKNRETIKIENLNKSKAQPITIQIPEKFNSIGIIDGQHRVFAYHEGSDKYESTISIERQKQNLLITGIIYPPHNNAETKLRFESNLFLEINDKQTRVRPDLRQAIQKIVNPFESTSIAKAVITELSMNGPLEDKLEVHFYDAGKIKTTSIVSYGLKHIVKYEGDDTLFKIWSKRNKEELLKKKNRVLLREYIDFCVKEINSFFTGYKQIISSKNLFVLNQKVSRALTSTAINGVVFCLRKVIENNKTGDIEYYKKAFNRLDINFIPSKFLYKSSHWKALGDKIYEQCF